MVVGTRPQPAPQANLQASGHTPVPSSNTRLSAPATALYWQFFYPRAIWRESKYGVSLKATQAVADMSNGGVLYYFCHIHSKMSGKIQIMNGDGSNFTNAKAEKELYPGQAYPPTISAFDEICGTVGISEYATGQSLGCEAVFLSGTIDSPFERCLNVLEWVERSPAHASRMVAFTGPQLGPVGPVALRFHAVMCPPCVTATWEGLPVPT